MLAGAVDDRDGVVVVVEVVVVVVVVVDVVVAIVVVFVCDGAAGFATEGDVAAVVAAFGKAIVIVVAAVDTAVCDLRAPSSLSTRACLSTT